MMGDVERFVADDILRPDEFPRDNDPYWCVSLQIVMECCVLCINTLVCLCSGS